MKDRFIYVSEHCTLIDTGTNMHYDACGGGDGMPFLIKFANKLVKENEMLKSKNQELFDELQVTMSFKSLKMGEISILERENEQLKKEIDLANRFHSLDKSKYDKKVEENKKLKEELFTIKMTNEKQLCSDCKHLEHDSGCGIWCGVGGNNRNYNCLKYEKR